MEEEVPQSERPRPEHRSTCRIAREAHVRRCDARYTGDDHRSIDMFLFHLVRGWPVELSHLLDLPQCDDQRGRKRCARRILSVSHERRIDRSKTRGIHRGADRRWRIRSRGEIRVGTIWPACAARCRRAFSIFAPKSNRNRRHA